MTSQAIETSGSARDRSLLAVLEQGVVLVAELLSAVLVVCEILLLFAGIVSRYLLHSPLTWADELASILFLWMVMIGSAVASRRNAHMRMTVIVGMVAARRQTLLDMFAVAATLLFLALVAVPALDYAYGEIVITTPGLGISNAWRAAALPGGILLMIVMTLLRLGHIGGFREIVAVGSAFAGIAAVLWFLAPLFHSLGNFNLVIFFVGMAGGLVLIGVPIAFCFGLSTAAYFLLAANAPLFVVVGRMEEGMSHLILLAIPLFVFLGALMELTGMATAMLRFLVHLLGRVRGGLFYTLIGAMYLVSGISGSKAADMAAIAPALFPEMKARGAKPGDLVALLAATGAQTETIPPSLVLITLGSITGVSTAALFTGGMLPALVLGILLCGVVWLRYRHENLDHVRQIDLLTILKSFMIAVPALALPFLIRTAVVEGVATATEVSTIGIFYAILVGLIVYRRFEWRRFVPALVDTAVLSATILMIIGAATAMAWALTQSGFANSLAKAMSSLPGGHATFLIVSIVLFVALGSLLEGIPAIVLFGPLLFPIARSMGVNDVHYAMVIILSMGIGLFAPPFGIGYYSACAIAKVDPNEGLRPIWGYLLACLIGICIVAAFPWLSTSL